MLEGKRMNGQNEKSAEKERKEHVFCGQNDMEIFHYIYIIYVYCYDVFALRSEEGGHYSRGMDDSENNNIHHQCYFTFNTI